MELLRIPTQELDKAWGLVHKDIRQALAYSGQLTDSDFVYDLLKDHTGLISEVKLRLKKGKD